MPAYVEPLDALPHYWMEFDILDKMRSTPDVEFPFVFLGPVSQLAPGALPPVKIRKSIYNAAVAGFAISLLLVFVDAIVGRPEWSAHFGLSAIISYVLIWVAACCRPESVEFGNLKTFRDLACVLAGAKPN